MSRFNVFLRGIYSTALTKLFLDNDFKIIFPSKSIQDRFGIEYDQSQGFSKDITISTRYDKLGVSVLMKEHVYESLKENDFKNWPLSFEEGFDNIIFKARFPKNSIYKGIIHQTNKGKNYSIVRLKPSEVDERGDEVIDEFHTNFGKYNYYLPEGKEQIFQVVQEDVGEHYATLDRNYSIPGDLVVLMPTNRHHIISKDIYRKEDRNRMKRLCQKLPSNRYGVIFRTAALYATDEQIQEEIDQLERELEEFNQIKQDRMTIGKLKSRFVSFNIIFSKNFRRKLDEIRRSATPTVENHHAYKIDKPDEVTYNYDHFLNFAENLLGKIPEKQKIIDQELWNFYYSFIHRKKLINIHHFKLNGRQFDLTPGIVKAFTMTDQGNYRIVLKRRVRGGGRGYTYDGLDAAIEYGDYAIGKYTNNNWFYKTEYYSKNNELKGKYINVNTPLEIRQGAISYVDLEIDVVEYLDGTRKIIDEDKLDKGFKCGYISEKLYNQAKEIAYGLQQRGGQKSEKDEK